MYYKAAHKRAQCVFKYVTRSNETFTDRFQQRETHRKMFTIDSHEENVLDIYYDLSERKEQNTSRKLLEFLRVMSNQFYLSRFCFGPITKEVLLWYDSR